MLMQHPYAVFCAGERCGLVERPDQITKLLAADERAEVISGRRGYVLLEDLDAWLCLDRVFKLADFLPKSYVTIEAFPSGVRCFALRSSLRTFGYVLEPGC